MARYKGVVLAAGFGTRLKPLTETYTKAKLPFFTSSSIYHPLLRLANAGITDIAINAHHHPEQIRQLIERCPVKNLNLHLSIETEILGSGGAYNPLKNWRNGSPVLTYNPDIICNVDIKEALQQHEELGTIATMVVIPKHPFNRTSNVYLRDSHVVGISDHGEKTNEATYGAALFIMEDEFLEMLPQGESNLMKIYFRCLEEKRPIGAYVYNGFWADMGESLRAYYDYHRMVLDRDLLKDLQFDQILNLENRSWEIKNGNFFLSPTTTEIIGSGNFIYHDTEIENGASLENCIVLPNTRISANENLQATIAWGQTPSDYTSRICIG